MYLYRVTGHGVIFWFSLNIGLWFKKKRSDLWSSVTVKFTIHHLVVNAPWRPSSSSPPPSPSSYSSSHLQSPIRWPFARPDIFCRLHKWWTGGKPRSRGRRTQRLSSRPCTDRSAGTAPGYRTSGSPSCRLRHRWPGGRARRRPRRAPGWCTTSGPLPAAAPGPACPAGWRRTARGWGARRARPQRGRSGRSPRTCWRRWWSTVRRRTQSARSGRSPRNSAGTWGCSSSPVAGKLGLASLSSGHSCHSCDPVYFDYLPGQGGCSLPAATSWRKDEQKVKIPELKNQTWVSTLDSSEWWRLVL